MALSAIKYGKFWILVWQITFSKYDFCGKSKLIMSLHCLYYCYFQEHIIALTVINKIYMLRFEIRLSLIK